VIDQEYVVFISSEGDLRAASFDLESLTTGRSITLLPDVWTTSYAGQGQYDITPDGTLVYVPGPYANVGQLVKADADGVIRELPLPTAAYLPFDVSPDGRRLAAAVEGVTGQELRIYDLETGREQTWFTSMHIGHPRWSPTGDGILVSVASLADTPVHSMVFG
jgi:dipeptidyl aminopeptidase/acylaminoacyl peptidase